MVNERKQIVESKLEKYSVAENIYEILDKLSFKESSSQLQDWKLFTRKNENNEFASVYKNKEFLIKGPYSNIDIPKKDLENITKYIFNERWISKKIRKGDLIIPAMSAFPIAGVWTSAYDIFNENFDLLKSINKYLKFLDPIPENAVAILLVCGILGGSIVAGNATLAAKSLLNKYYGSKLSKEAENYDYGINAEMNLEKEFTFEIIKSGELKKQDFLKPQRYELLFSLQKLLG